MVEVEQVSSITAELAASPLAGFAAGDLSGQPTVLLIVALAILFLLVGLVALRRVKGINTGEEQRDRLYGIMGRLEKLEITLNEFKSSNARAIEIFRGDIGFLKQELREIRHLLQGGGGGGTPPPGDSEPTPPTSSDDGEAAAPAAAAIAHAEVVEPAPLVAEPAAVAAEPAALTDRLTRSRRGFWGRFKGFFSRTTVDESSLEELEGLLIESDFGPKMAAALVSDVKAAAAEKGGAYGAEELKALLKTRLNEKLQISSGTSEISGARRADGPNVVMVVGVNGVGKTTTIAKLASRLQRHGAKVLVIAADTFRAAAVEQLQAWCQRVGVEVVTGAPEAKPQSVVFDGMERAKAAGVDVVLIDTAGRLHTKTNLMQELEGVRNIVQRHIPSAPHEVILVLDGATGQNALSQAREFNAAVAVTGIVVTKLDGTPKGGIVVAIREELGLPVRYIGVGESEHDLRPFAPAQFVDALFDERNLEESAPSAHGETRRRRREEARA